MRTSHLRLWALRATPSSYLSYEVNIVLLILKIEANGDKPVCSRLFIRRGTWIGTQDSWLTTLKYNTTLPFCAALCTQLWKKMMKTWNKVSKILTFCIYRINEFLIILLLDVISRYDTCHASVASLLKTPKMSSRNENLIFNLHFHVFCLKKIQLMSCTSAPLHPN